MKRAADITAGIAPRELHGASIIAALKASGIEYVLAVPDIVTSSGLLAPAARDKDFRLIRVCKEDECIGIASGAGEVSFTRERTIMQGAPSCPFRCRFAPR